MTTARSTSVHVNSFLYFLWHNWRVSCFEGWTQTLTSVCTVDKSTSTWSASPRPYSPTYTWRTLQHMATAGKHRDFVTSFFWTEGVRFCVFASVDYCLQETSTFAVNRHSTGQGWSVCMSQFDDIWEQSLHKHLYNWSHSQCESLSCLERCMQKATLAFPSVEGAGCRPRQLPSSKQVLRWFLHQSTEKPDFPAMVLFMNEPCFTWERFFSSHSSHVCAQANPIAASNIGL